MDISHFIHSIEPGETIVEEKQMQGKELITRKNENIKVYFLLQDPCSKDGFLNTEITNDTNDTIFYMNDLFSYYKESNDSWLPLVYPSNYVKNDIGYSIPSQKSIQIKFFLPPQKEYPKGKYKLQLLFHSLLNTFDKMKFGSYWFETGTPTYLVNLLKKHHYDLERMAHEETDEQVLNSIDSESSNPLPVIYQSGYLTIKGYDERFGIYRLGFPNREVEEGFVRFLLPYYANVNKVESSFEIQKFVREVESGDYNSFFRRLQSFFADTGYDVIREQELHYENVLFIVFKLVGFYTKVEYHTSEGRIDLVLQTDKFIYVMEFKLNGTAEEALKQINEKHYSLPFEADNRKLFKVGVNFSSQTRNIEKWIVEE